MCKSCTKIAAIWLNSNALFKVSRACASLPPWEIAYACAYYVHVESNSVPSTSKLRSHPHPSCAFHSRSFRGEVWGQMSDISIEGTFNLCVALQFLWSNFRNVIKKAMFSQQANYKDAFVDDLSYSSWNISYGSRIKIYSPADCSTLRHSRGAFYYSRRILVSREGGVGGVRLGGCGSDGGDGSGSGAPFRIASMALRA